MLRLGAAVGVVFLHAGIAYMGQPLRTTWWLVYDPAHHPLFDALVYACNGALMPLFFMLSGMGTAHGDSLTSALRSRWHRLGQPLVLGAIFILPGAHFLWAMGLLGSERMGLEYAINPKQATGFCGLMHLWFLRDLLLLQLAAVGVGRLLRGRGALVRQRVRAILGRPWAPLVWLMLPVLVLAFFPDSFLPIANGFLPEPGRLLYFAVFFVLGLGAGDAVAALAKWPRWVLVGFGLAALGALALAVPLAMRQSAAPRFGMERLGFAASAGIFATLGAALLLATAARLCPRWHQWRGATGMALWVYLLHLPLVALMQWQLLDQPWPALVKFAVTVAVTLVVGFFSYRMLVEDGRLAELLGGNAPPTTVGAWRRERGWIAVLVLCAALVGGAGYRWYGFFVHHGFSTVQAGQVYRSGRLSATELTRCIERQQLASVVVVEALSSGQDWRLDAVRSACSAAQIPYVHVPLPEGAAPSRDEIKALRAALDAAPRPYLIISRRGLGRAAFASALVHIDAGAGMDRAEAEFDLKHFELDGLHHPLGKVLTDFKAWIRSQRRPADRAALTDWLETAYSGPGPRYENPVTFGRRFTE